MPTVKDLKEQQENCKEQAQLLYKVSKEVQNILKPYIGKRILQDEEDFIEEIDDKIIDLHMNRDKYGWFSIITTTPLGIIVTNYEDGIFFRIAEVKDMILIKFYDLDEQLHDYFDKLSLTEEQLKEIIKAYEVLQNTPECLMKYFPM